MSINLLQLAKTAFTRCRALSPAKDLPSNAAEILGILVSYLIHEHLDYAIEIGLQGIPLPEGNKSVPELYFFDVVGQTNAIQHLFEKQFHDSVLPLVVSTPRHVDCVGKKKNELEKLERKLDTGLDRYVKQGKGKFLLIFLLRQNVFSLRTLNALAGWVKTILAQEQRKSDFNPPSSKMDITTTPSSACTR